MRRRLWWTLGAALAVVGAIAAVLVVTRGPDGPPGGAEPQAAAQPVHTPPAPARPQPAEPRLDAVAAAAPITFDMRGPKFRIRAHVCAMPFVRPLDPPGEQHHTVCWVAHDFGVAPANPSHGTSYLLGHAWAEDPQEVLNPMSKLAMRQVHLGKPASTGGVPIYPVTDLDGYTITLTTTAGRLTYRVARAFAVSKDRAGDVRSVMAEHTPDRLVLITCGVRGGRDVDVNVIAYATLVRAVATPA